MSQFADTFENIKIKINEIFEKIKESETYQQISDRYETLTPSGQKMAQACSAFIILFIILYIPMTQILSSKELITGFENKRNLIRDLFKTYRETNQMNRFSQTPDANTLISLINSTLESEQLLPEQIVFVALGAPEGRLIPQNLMTNVVDVKLAKLNLRQIVDIGSRLSGLSQSVKLKDLLMTAHSEASGYFDVTYKLYSLNIPKPAIEPLPELDSKSTKNKKNNDSAKGDDQL